MNVFSFDFIFFVVLSVNLARMFYRGVYTHLSDDAPSFCYRIFAPKFNHKDKQENQPKATSPPLELSLEV